MSKLPNPEWIEERVKSFLKKIYEKPIYPISVKDLSDFIKEILQEAGITEN